MADPSVRPTGYHEPSIAGLHVQIASMKAGFSAYTQAVKHHSLMLNRQQHRIDELEDSNKKKDATISGLEESRVKMAEEHEEARVRMTAAIEDMERRMNEMQQNNGDEEQVVRTRAVPECQQADAGAAGEQLTQAEKKTTNKDLYDVAGSGCLRDVQGLLKRGAEIDSQHNKKYTPLLIASKNGHSEVLKELLAWGAAVHARNGDQETALMLASESGHLPVVEALIAHGAMIDARDYPHWTALNFACYNGHVQISEALIGQGANIDAQTSVGSTPLLLASWKNFPAVVEALIRLGANINMKNNQGRTALYHARREGHENIVRILEAAGAQE